jgi:hypothetical protein
MPPAPCLGGLSLKDRRGDGCFSSSTHELAHVSFALSVFLLTATTFSIPTGLIAGALLLLALPADFPNQGRAKPKEPVSIGNVDFIGAFLMLSAVALTITGVEQAASLLSWRTIEVLGPLCASAIAWIAFFASQYWHASRPQSVVEPVLPWRFCQNRVVVGLILYFES